MKTFFGNLWDRLRANYWLVPSLLALCAVFLSYFLPWLDGYIQNSGISLPKSVLTTTDAARASLSAVAGAMVTVSGTVFSVTIVTLSLTSQQFGPRLLRRFISDRPTQFTLGVFLSSALYCLLILRIIEHHVQSPFVPHLSVLAAMLMSVLSMAMLILFIHHVASLIQAPNVVASIAADMGQTIERIFPEELGYDSTSSKASKSLDVSLLNLSKSPMFKIFSSKEGYLQTIDENGLLQLACKEDILIRLHCRPGDFISYNKLICESYPRGPQASSQARDVSEKVNHVFTVGSQRTARQDIECGLLSFVEIAVRSLSPSINDPFTAMNCIDRLGASLGRILERKLPLALRLDNNGDLRIIVRPVSFDQLLRVSFHQILHYGRQSAEVNISVLEALSNVETRAPLPQKSSVLKTARIVLKNASNIVEPYDRMRVIEKYNLLFSNDDTSNAFDGEVAAP